VSKREGGWIAGDLLKAINDTMPSEIKDVVTFVPSDNRACSLRSGMGVCGTVAGPDHLLTIPAPIERVAQEEVAGGLFDR
jgi:hypothetical protein